MADLKALVSFNSRLLRKPKVPFPNSRIISMEDDPLVSLSMLDGKTLRVLVSLMHRTMVKAMVDLVMQL